MFEDFNLEIAFCERIQIATHSNSFSILGESECKLSHKFQ